MFRLPEILLRGSNGWSLLFIGSRSLKKPPGMHLNAPSFFRKQNMPPPHRMFLHKPLKNPIASAWGRRSYEKAMKENKFHIISIMDDHTLRRKGLSEEGSIGQNNGIGEGLTSINLSEPA